MWRDAAAESSLGVLVAIGDGAAVGEPVGAGVEDKGVSLTSAALGGSLRCADGAQPPVSAAATTADEHPTISRLAQLSDEGLGSERFGNVVVIDSPPEFHCSPGLSFRLGALLPLLGTPSA